MILLNPFNGDTRPLFEMHITFAEDWDVIAQIKDHHILNSLRAKVTPIMFYHRDTPAQYMLTYLSRHDLFHHTLMGVKTILRSFGARILRTKIEVPYSYFNLHRDNHEFKYFETHIVLPIECHHLIKPTAVLLKSFNSNKPHEFSLTNRYALDSNMETYSTGIRELLRRIDTICREVPKYVEQYSNSTVMIETCIFDSNPEIDDAWLAHKE